MVVALTSLALAPGQLDPTQVTLPAAPLGMPVLALVWVIGALAFPPLAMA